MVRSVPKAICQYRNRSGNSCNPAPIHRVVKSNTSWQVTLRPSHFLSGPKWGSARPIGIEPETKTAFHLCSPADSKAHAGVGQAKAEASFAHSKRCREVQ